LFEVKKFSSNLLHTFFLIHLIVTTDFAAELIKQSSIFFNRVIIYFHTFTFNGKNVVFTLEVSTTFMLGQMVLRIKSGKTQKV